MNSDLKAQKCFWGELKNYDKLTVTLKNFTGYRMIHMGKG